MACLGGFSILAMGCQRTSLPAHNPVTFTFVNLPPLAAGTEGHYGLWAVLRGEPTLLGSFQVDLAGRIRGMDGGPLSGFETGGAADTATQVILSIEPDMEEGTRPTTHTPRFFIPSLAGNGGSPAIPLLSGLVSGGIGMATLNMSFKFGTVSRGASVYATATGTFALATPTENPTDTTLSGRAGVWFINPTSGQPGLNLPPLSQQFSYRAWLMTPAGPLEIGGMPGDPSSITELLHPGGFFDDSAIYSGQAGVASRDSFLDYPGEDFLANSPDPHLFPFPMSVLNQEVLVSIDPVPMVADHPFLPCLRATVPSAVAVRTQGIAMTNLFSASGGRQLPSGLVQLF